MAVVIAVTGSLAVRRATHFRFAVETDARLSICVGAIAGRSSHVLTGDASEARSVRTPVYVNTGETISAVPLAACAAVQARAVVIAERVDVAGVKLRALARVDLTAGAPIRVGESVSEITGTVIGVGANIGACATDTTR
jgi:hypothetical protein